MTEIGLFEAIYSARALRRLKPDPVPDDVIARILDAAIRALTSPRGRVVLVQAAKPRALADMRRRLRRSSCLPRSPGNRFRSSCGWRSRPSRVIAGMRRGTVEPVLGVRHLARTVCGDVNYNPSM